MMIETEQKKEFRLSYKFRIYPKKNQIQKMNNMMYEEKKVYNELLGLKKDTYLFLGLRYFFNYTLDIEKENEIFRGFRFIFGIYYYGNKKSLSKYDLINHLSGRCKTGKLYSQSYGALADVVIKSYDNFFRRFKEHKQGSLKKNELGFPKFKSYIDFIIYPQAGFKIVDEKSLFISKIGYIPIIFHRNMLGKIKTLTIKKNKSNDWHVCFSCDISKETIINLNNPLDIINIIGIDNNTGKDWMTLSNGEKISYPRYLIKAQKRLLMLQKKLSKKRIGSNNRKKHKILLAKEYQKVIDKRDNFFHQITNQLTNKYNIICCEDTNIKELVVQNSKKNKDKSKLTSKNINILDCSWGKFKQILIYKQQMKGGLLLNNPRTRGSSKRCSNCDFEKDVLHMPLNIREYVCENCGLRLDRDVNAANNHLKNCLEKHNQEIKNYMLKNSISKLNIENTDGLSEIEAQQRINNGWFNEVGTTFKKVQVIEPIIGSP